MPKTGKKRTFRGISAQKKKENTDTIATATASNNTTTSQQQDSAVNNDELLNLDSIPSVSQQDDSMQSESLTDCSENAESETEGYKTASEKKLQLSFGEQAGCCSSKEGLAYDKGYRTGYRLIDLECLNNALKVAHRCKGG